MHKHTHIKTQESHTQIDTHTHAHIGDETVEMCAEFHKRLIISVLKQETQAEKDRWRETGNDLHPSVGREI